MSFLFLLDLFAFKLLSRQAGAEGISGQFIAPHPVQDIIFWPKSFPLMDVLSLESPLRQLSRF
jgi:hypothetical protein